jgi:hypothetical protein
MVAISALLIHAPGMLGIIVLSRASMTLTDKSLLHQQLFALLWNGFSQTCVQCIILSSTPLLS